MVPFGDVIIEYFYLNEKKMGVESIGSNFKETFYLLMMTAKKYMIT